MPPKKVPFLHIYFIAFFDGVCGADLFWPNFGGLVPYLLRMGALVLLSMMAMSLAEAQYGPNRVAASGPVSSRASVFRSVLDPQLEFGPTGPAAGPYMPTRSFQTMRI